MIFLNGELNTMQTGYFFTPPDEIYQRIQPDFILSIIFGLLYFFYKEKPSFVCIKCGKAKVSDTSSKCECGGNFENIEEMKWHEHKK
jgi:hypothetical protein